VGGNSKAAQNTQRFHWVVFLLHGVLGPASGAAIVSILVTAMLALEGGDASDWNDWRFIVLILFLAGYYYGTIPALLTGGWLAFSLRRHRSYSRAHAAATGIITTMFWIALFALLNPEIRDPPGVFMITCGLLGAGAAIIVRRLLIWAGYMPRSYTPNRTPRACREGRTT